MQYTVKINFSGNISLTVEADSRDEAEDKAYHKIDGADGWDILENANWFTAFVKEDE